MEKLGRLYQFVKECNEFRVLPMKNGGEGCFICPKVKEPELLEEPAPSRPEPHVEEKLEAPPVE